LIKEVDMEVRIMTDESTICPQCFRRIPSTVMPAENSRMGYLMRVYYGWCEGCNKGFEVVQFKRAATANNSIPLAINIEADNERWHIHRYRPYRLRYEVLVEVEALPDAPVVIKGPGGDYDEDIRDSEMLEEIIRMANIFASKLNIVIKKLKQK
jgi:hypothetical protein